MTRRLLFILTALGALAVVACGGASNSSSAATPSISQGPPTALTITAKDIAFTPASMSAPAGSPLQIRFENQDAGVPHNLGLFAGAGSGPKVYESAIKTGPAVEQIEIPGLVPGAYQFRCSVHPNMTAALTVEG